MADAASTGLNPPLQWTAFYGDPQLAQFYFNRLRWHAKAGQLQEARHPAWQNGKGTVSAAMVHSNKPELFERMTGLPYSLALVLEMLHLTTTRDIDMLAEALQPGTDTRDVAAHVMRDWYANPACRWSELIGDQQVDDLRLEWIAACGRWLSDGTTGDAAELVERMRTLVRPNNAMHTVQNTVLENLIALSPPPSAQDVSLWWRITMSRGIHSKFMLAQFDLGWSTSDFAKEKELLQWFTEREKQEPGGKFTDATLRIAQEEWSLQPKDLDYIAKEEYFFKHMNSALAPFNEQLRNTFKEQMDAAPRTQQVVEEPRVEYAAR